MIEENASSEAKMIEENAIQEAAKAKEGEYWQISWYAKGCSSDGRQRRFSFICEICEKKC